MARRATMLLLVAMIGAVHMITAFTPASPVHFSSLHAPSRSVSSVTALRMSVEHRGIDRRKLFRSVLLAPAVLAPFVDQAYMPIASAAEAQSQEQVLEALKNDIIDLLKADKELGAGLVRLSFHSSGTYDKYTRTGGSSKGTIRFEQELAHEANAGLKRIVDRLEPLKQKYPTVSYADLYTYSGAVTVEALGGPHIEWKGGRVDSYDPKDANPEGRLPDPVVPNDKAYLKEIEYTGGLPGQHGPSYKTIAYLRKIFGRMGFNDQEIVILSGAHTLGQCHIDDSGYDGVWVENPYKFDNAYFNILLQPGASDGDVLSAENWKPMTLYGKLQFVDPLAIYVMLPTDMALIQDPQMLEWVKVYAANSPRFYRDFAVTYAKLLALGT